MNDDELESSPDRFDEWFADEHSTELDDDVDLCEFDVMDDIDE